MATFVATLVVFCLVALAMSVGVLVQGRRLRGSCGGTGQSCSCGPIAARHCSIRQRQTQQQPS